MITILLKKVNLCDSNYWKQNLSNKEKDEMYKLIYLLEIN